MFISRIVPVLAALAFVLIGSQASVAGPVFAAVGWDGEFARIDAGSGEVNVVSDGLPPELQGVVLSPDGTLYAGSGMDGYLYSIDLVTGAAEHFISVETEIRGMTFSPDGILYVIARDAHIEATVLRTIDLTDGTHTDIGALPYVGVRAQGLAFSPNGELFAVRSFSEFFDLYTIDLDDLEMHLIGRQVGQLNQGLTFTPDGSLYALGQRAFAELDPDNGSIIGPTVSFSGDYRGLAFIPEPTALLLLAAGASLALGVRRSRAKTGTGA